MLIKLPKRTISNLLMYTSILMLVIITALPITQVLPSTVRQIVQILAVGAHFLGAFLDLKKLKNNIILILLIVFFMIYYFGTWANHNMTLNQYSFNVITLCIFATYGTYIIKSKDEFREFSLLYKIIVIIVIVTAITTTIGLIKYPLAVRDLGRTAGFLNTDIKREYMMRNIGTWSHLYGIVFISPSFLLVFKHKKIKRYLLYWIICGVMIVTSQVTYATILFFLLAFFVYLDFNKSRKALITSGLLIAATCIVIINFKSILSWIIDILRINNYSTLSSKLNDLFTLLYYRQAIGDAESRLGLYANSFNAFLNYPIGGLFIEGKTGQSILGFHSDILDIMGYFGLIGIIFLSFICVKYVNELSRNIKDKRYYILLFVFYLIIFFLNAMLFSPIVSFGVFIMPTLVAKYEETINIFEGCSGNLMHQVTMNTAL